LYDWDEEPKADEWGAYGEKINLIQVNKNEENIFRESSFKNNANDNAATSINHSILQNEEKKLISPINEPKASLLNEICDTNNNTLKKEECAFNFKEDTHRIRRFMSEFKINDNLNPETKFEIINKNLNEIEKTPTLSTKEICDIFPTPEMDPTSKELDIGKSVLHEETLANKQELENESLLKVKEKNLKEIFIDVPPCTSASTNGNFFNMPRLSAVLHCSTPKSSVNPKPAPFPKENQETHVPKTGDTSLTTNISRKQDLNSSFKTLKVTKLFQFGTTYKCYISNVESPSLFFIQLKDKADIITKMGEKLK